MTGDALARMIERTMGERATANIAARTVGAGARLGRMLDEADKPLPSQDIRPAMLDVSEESDVIRTVLFHAKPLEQEPELFYGPFMQLGTKLKLGPDWMQFVIDTVTDPLTYALGGTGGLVAKATKGAVGMTRAAKNARLVSALVRGAEQAGGEVALASMERALKAAGSILGSGKREAMLQAARTGDKAFVGLVDEALKAGQMEPEIASMLGAMQKDHKALAWVLDNTDELLGFKELPAALIPQKTMAARIATGQARPLIQFGIPAITEPLNLGKQLIGIGYRGERFITPFAGTIASRGLRSLKGPPARILTEAAARQATGFGERAFKTGDMTLADVDFTLSYADVALGVPSDHIAREIGAGDIPAKAVNAIWAKVPERMRKAMDKSSLMGKVLGSLQRGALETDKLRMAARDARMDALIGERAIEGISPLAAAPDLVAERAASLRRFGDIFGNESLFREGAAGTLHLNLASRPEAIGLISSAFDGQAREILIRNSGSLAAADEVDGVLRYLREIPEAWETRVVNGEARTFLLPEKVTPGGLFEERLNLSSGDGLRTYLTETGLGPEVVGLAARVGQSLDLIGRNLRDEKALLGWLEAYWSATFKRNKAFGLRFGEGPEAWSRMAGQAVYDPETLADISPDLVEQFKGIKEKMKAGKLSPFETRRVADDMRAMLERKGYGRYEPSSIKTAAHAIDAYGKALMERKLLIDLPKIAGDMVWDSLPKHMAKTVTPEQVLKHGLKSVYGDGEVPPKQFEHLYMRIALRSGRSEVVSKSDAAAYAAQAFSEDMTARAVDEGWETIAAAQESMSKAAERLEYMTAKAMDAAGAKVGADLSGRKSLKIGGETIRIRVKSAEDTSVGFLAEWAELNDYPEGLAFKDKIKAHVDGLIEKERERLRKTADKAIVRLKKDLVGSGIKTALEATREAGSAAGAMREAAEKIAAQESRRVPPKAVVHVRKDWGSHFIESFSLWDQQGINKGVMQSLGKLNASLKATVLLGDIYHMHSLTVNKLVAAGPAAVFKMLLDPNGNMLPGVKAGAWGQTEQFKALRRGAAARAAVGAATGAATGAAFGADEEGIGTLSLVGALYGAVLGAARINAMWGKRLALSPESYEFLHYMSKANWSGRPDDRSIGMVTGWLKALRDNIVRKHGDSLAISPIEKAIHVNELWEKELWGAFHNGGKTWLFATLWQQELPKLERSVGWATKTAAEQEQLKVELARQLVQFGNNALGGQNVAALLAHPKFIHYARWGLLAPDWTASRLQMASGYYYGMSKPMQALVGAGLGTALELAEAGFDPEEIKGMGAVGGAGIGLVLGGWSQRIAQRLAVRGDVLARRSRNAASTALMAGFVTAALMNKALSGKWIWENEEGKKTSIEIPGRTETGRKRYISFGKQWLEAYEFAGISEKDQFALPFFGRLESKLSVPVGGLVHLTTNDNIWGPIASADDNVAERAFKLGHFAFRSVTPIIVQGPLDLATRAAMGQGLTPAGGAEAALRFAGIPMNRSPRPPAPLLNPGVFAPVQQPPLIGTSLLESRF